MAHEILGQRFLSLEKPGWHGLGRVFDNPILIEEAIYEVSGDIIFVKLPLYSKFEADDVEVDLPAIGENDSETYGLWRMPTNDDPYPRFIDTITNKWTVRQFTEYAEDLKMLNESFTLTTAGTLRQGRHVFASLSGKPYDLNFPGGYIESIENYFVIDLSGEPGSAHRILYTPVRVVCQNTLTMGANESSINISLGHGTNVADGVQLVAEMAEAMESQAEATKLLFEKMGHTPLSNTDIKTVLAKVYPLKKKPAKVALLDSMNPEQIAELIEKGTKGIDQIMKAEQAWVSVNERQKKMREISKELLDKFNNEYPAVANTSWALYNAITENADHREPHHREDYEYSVLFGARADEKVRAWKACKALIETN